MKEKPTGWDADFSCLPRLLPKTALLADERPVTKASPEFHGPLLNCQRPTLRLSPGSHYKASTIVITKNDGGIIGM